MNGTTNGTTNKPRVKNGRLSPAPTSLEEAVRRQRYVGGEIARIQGQLDDPDREARLGASAVAYAQWRQRAGDVLRAFRCEARLFAEWVDIVYLSSGRELLSEAYALLKTLERETDFDPPEKDLMRKLDAHFNNNNNEAEASERKTA